MNILGRNKLPEVQAMAVVQGIPELLLPTTSQNWALGKGA